MFQNVKNILISGGCYNESTTLEDILSQRMNIVYGRNGSGKSSLAKAIYDYAHETDESKFSLSFYPELSNDAKKRIFVYSEDFVLDNVKLAQDGLEQIVMIGEQVDLDNKEEDLKNEKEKVNKELDNEETRLLEITDKKNNIEKELLEVIKKDYAGREKEFRRLIRNPNTNVETISLIYEKKAESTKYNIGDLSRKFSEDTKKLLGASDAQKVVWTTPDCLMPFAIQAASMLLQKKVQQVELDERDRYLIALLSNPERSHYIDEAKKDLIDAKAERCPLCQQPLDKEWLESLEGQIKRVLNKDAEGYKSELTETGNLLSDISVPAPCFPIDTYDADIISYNKAVTEINQALKNVRDRLNTKTMNLFNSEDALNIDTYSKLYSSLEQACTKLQNDINAFNNSIDNKKKLENMLKENNKILTYLENRNTFDTYYDTIDKINTLQDNIAKLKKGINNIDTQLNGIKSQRSQTKIAIDFINHCLSSIFFDRDRLTIQDADGKFVLKSRGKSVAPDSVSTGERNIIGLAYFFASIYGNTSKDDRFNQPYLVVIDDPITSFDQDNRLGMMTFLKERITDLLVNSEDSKVLVMSHDQRTIDILTSINSHVENKIKYKAGQTGHDDCYIYELHRKDRRKAYTKTKNEYSQMLNLLYLFALDNNPEKIEYTGIGNTIRRVLETFSLMTFNIADYVKVVDRPSLRLYPPHECDRNMVKNVYRRILTRIVLNPESHSATQIDQDSYESTFTRESLQKLAQYTLTFIMCVNDQHLWNSLDQGWKEKVDEWFDNLVQTEI